MLLVMVLLIMSIIFKPVIYLLYKLFNKTKIKLIHKLILMLNGIYEEIALFIDSGKNKTIPKYELVNLGLRNVMSNKSRLLVTVAGMAIGIGAIVLLLSVGYGLQSSINSRIASFSEQMVFDVFPRRGERVKLDDETIIKIKNFEVVENIYPVIAAVAKVRSGKSESEIPAYAVSADYLHIISRDKITGETYQDNVLNVDGSVKGAETQILEEDIKLDQFKFELNPKTWVPVYEMPDLNSAIIGYTNSTQENGLGLIEWGAKYSKKDDSLIENKSSNGTPIERWIKADFVISKTDKCKIDNKKCIKYELNKTSGYITMDMVLKIDQGLYDKVLGVEDEEVVEEEFEELEEEVKIIPFNDKAEKKAVVNLAFLKILNLDEREALGKSFDVSFILSSYQLGIDDAKTETETVSYTISGIMDDETAPIIYVPFSDIKALGVKYYNQVKVKTSDRNKIDTARKMVETMGYSTSSIVDIVDQIDEVFSVVRAILASIGMFSLIVAALGMFNTLTVSLLERTKEIGLLKAMGMSSDEIKNLFLTESMAMGILGGFTGLLTGFVLGKLLSLILYYSSLVKLEGPFDFSVIPNELMLFIIMVSIATGVLTGYYPARRATKISALRALRFE